MRLLSRYRYDNLGRIASVRAPLLVVHSRGDEIVPFRQGQALFAAASEPKRFLELQGGHNDGFLASGVGYRRGLAEFLAGRGRAGAPWQTPARPLDAPLSPVWTPGWISVQGRKGQGLRRVGGQWLLRKHRFTDAGGSQDGLQVKTRGVAACVMKATDAPVGAVAGQPSGRVRNRRAISAAHG